MGSGCFCPHSSHLPPKPVITPVSEVITRFTPSDHDLSLTDYKSLHEPAMHRKVSELYVTTEQQMQAGREVCIQLEALKAKDKDWMQVIVLLSYCAGVRRLELGNVTISQKSLDLLAMQIGTLTQLERLSLNDMNLGSFDFTHFRHGLNSLVSLTSLSLTTNFLRSDHLTVLIPSIAHMRDLEELHLDHNEIDHTGVEVMTCFLGNMMKLKLISMCGNEIGVHGKRMVENWVTKNKICVRVE